MRTWLSIARGRAAEDVYSDCKWKWMTTDCPGMGWEGELSSGWGMLAGLSRSLKMSFVTLLLSSPFSRGKKPQQAWARAGEDGRSGGKGLKRAVRVSPAAMGDRAKASACICSCWAHLCACWAKKCPHVQMKMAESTSAVVPGSSASPHKQHNLSLLQTFIFWVERRAEHSYDSKAKKLTGCLEN